MANQRMTQTQLVRTLAESCEVNNKVSRSMLDCLASTAIAEVKKNVANLLMTAKAALRG